MIKKKIKLPIGVTSAVQDVTTVNVSSSKSQKQGEYYEKKDKNGSITDSGYELIEQVGFTATLIVSYYASEAEFTKKLAITERVVTTFFESDKTIFEFLQSSVISDNVEKLISYE